MKSKPEFLVFIFCFVSVSKPDIDKLYEAIKVYHESKGHSDGKGTDLIFDPQVPKLLLLSYGEFGDMYANLVILATACMFYWSSGVCLGH